MVFVARIACFFFLCCVVVFVDVVLDFLLSCWIVPGDFVVPGVDVC